MTTTATTHSTIVAVQHNTLNTTVLRVTPLEDGMELVEYVGHLRTMERDGTHPDVVRLVHAARGMATTTGARSATHTEDHRDATTGKLVVDARAEWYRDAFSAPRLALGTHKARGIVSPEQAALAAELTAQRTGEPVEGQRWVVGELTGYQLVQNRPLDHRSCYCGDGTTTYAAGTVVAITYWADNSRDCTVELEDGRKVTVQLAAPSGDACF